MKPERYRRVKEIFSAVAALPEEARARYLDEVCSDDAELRREVEGLLAYDRSQANELEVSASRGSEPDPDFTPGDVVAGRYRVVDSVGEGGMGTVWRAEQDEPIRRTVAIKLIKAGMDSREVLARFEAERQALALMDHPNIARVVDAGMTKAGRPFFAMEFVEGIPLTEYCDRERLSVPERLELFVAICGAVQHAHQKGVIHRDLKPSNILVGTRDGTPVPKVIDFGLAKAVEQSLTDKTLQTAHGVMLGTPMYMSPEQADVNRVDVDTRTDVYSLGVVLYELLTGTTPLQREQLQEAAVTEVLRVIREVDPPRPSTRLSASGLLPSVAAQRDILPARLMRDVSGDLDWVVMRALEKERERRYESASSLAADILRHLADEPVSAGPPSARYRMRKFVKRNRAAVVTAGFVALALLLGVIGTTTGLVWALDERDRADEQALLAEQAAAAEEEQRLAAEENEREARVEAARSAAVARLLRDALSGVAPSVALGRDTALLEEILGRTAERVESELEGQPEVEATLRSTLGTTYEQMGLLEEAERHSRRALQLYQARYAGDHVDTAVTLNTVGLILENLGEKAEAEERYRESLAIFERLDSKADDEDEGEALRNLATLLTFTDRQEEARGVLDEALERFHNANGGDDNSDVATVQTALGNLERTLRNHAEARRHYERALEIHQRVLPEGHPFVLIDMRNLAGLLEEMDEFAEAEELLRRTIALQRAIVGDHPDLAESLQMLGAMLRDQGRYVEAEENLREALAIASAAHPAGHPDIGRYRTALAILMSQTGRIEEGLELHRASLDEDLRSGADAESLITSYNNTAFALMKLDRLEEAEPMFRRADQLSAERDPDGSSQRAMCLNNLARCLSAMERYEDAIAAFEEALEMRKRIFGERSDTVANTLSSLANVYGALEDLERAEELKRASVDMYAEVLGPDHLFTAIVRGGLAAILLQKGAFDAAVAEFRTALGPIEAAFGSEHERTRTHLERLARAQVGLAELRIEERRFAEAEPLLLEAQQQVVDFGPLDDDSAAPADVLVRLYDAWHLAEPNAGHDASADEWRAAALEGE